ncbi:MAG: hypothetical protein ACO1RA_11345 [Planctomycetaceae bacterium]
MPIQVTCGQCQMTLAAPDALAGKAAKCPKCSAIIQVPGGNVPAPSPLSPLSPFANSTAAAGAGAPAGVAPGGSVCPTCYSSLPPNAVLCVKCGYNLKTKQQIKTVRGAGMGGAKLGGGDGHGDVASLILERAAQSIQEDAVAEKAKVSEGLPWWSYLVMLSMAIGFLVLMSFVPVKTAMVVMGSLIAVIGGLLNLFGAIMILKVAFTDNLVTGLLCLFVPFYVLIFTFSRWDTCGSYFLMQFGGGALQGLGMFTALYGAQMVTDDPAQAMMMFQMLGMIRR